MDAQMKFAKEIDKFEESMACIGVLRFCSTANVHKLVLQCVAAKNEAISEMALLVVANRWPAELLRRPELKRCSSVYRANLLAYVALEQPGLRKQAASMTSASLFKDSTNKLRESGLATFVTAGFILVGL